MNQLGTLVLPVSASSGFQPDLCHLKKMLSARRGRVPTRCGAVISGVAGKDTCLQILGFNHIDPRCRALLLLSFLVVVVVLEACGAILFLLLN